MTVINSQAALDEINRPLPWQEDAIEGAAIRLYRRLRKAGLMEGRGYARDAFYDLPLGTREWLTGLVRITVGPIIGVLVKTGTPLSALYTMDFWLDRQDALDEILTERNGGPCEHFADDATRSGWAPIGLAGQIVCRACATPAEAAAADQRAREYRNEA